MWFFVVIKSYLTSGVNFCNCILCPSSMKCQSIFSHLIHFAFSALIAFSALFAVSALMLLVGRRKGIRPVKN